MTYPVAVVIVNRHEPEGETAGRLLELAAEKGYGARVVEASRGDHDAGLTFRVPQDVADAFNEDRSDRWPTQAPSQEQDDEPRDTSIPVTDDEGKIQNDAAMTSDQVIDGESAPDKGAAAINEDAYAADQASESASDDDTNTHQARRSRTGKTKE